VLPLVELCSYFESPELCACPGLRLTPMDAMFHGLKRPLHRIGVLKIGSVFLRFLGYNTANAKNDQKILIQ
jgi:hypothetical protein